MAYMALYRKWRPQDFDDVVGQEHITATLQQAIEKDKVAHAYLFSGPRGTGKTSTAKIFAKAVNCVHGPTAHPCNDCGVCRHITSGESLDVAEIDAASNRSIEDIRQLRETVKFMPAEGRRKIYIIDEVHMLTTEAFNALLKTLEEPPAHIVFILATTEAERIPMTILSRCQRYEFRRLTSTDIGERLLYVAERENIDLTAGAAHIMAVQADGGMRDALSYLDQCAGTGADVVDEALVRSLFGLVGKDWLFSMAAALFAGRNGDLIKGVDDVIAMGKEPQMFLTELITHLRALLLCKAAPGTDTLSAYADSDTELRVQAEAVPTGRIFAVLNILQEALLRVKTSPLPRIAAETGLLMAARVRTADGDDLTARVKELEERVYAVPAAPVPSAKQAETEPERPVKEPPPQAAAASKAAADSVLSVNDASAALAVPVTEVVPAPVQADYARIWHDVCAVLDRERKKAVLSCVRAGRVAYIGETEFILALKTEFMVKRANREDYYSCIDAALTQVLGKGYHMRGYLEGGADLAAYEKKNADLTVETAAIPETAKKTPLREGKISPDDIPAEDREVLSPLLKQINDFHLYVEYKD